MLISCKYRSVLYKFKTPFLTSKYYLLFTDFLPRWMMQDIHGGTPDYLFIFNSLRKRMIFSRLCTSFQSFQCEDICSQSFILPVIHLYRGMFLVLAILKSGTLILRHKNTRARNVYSYSLFHFQTLYTCDA